MIGYVKVNRFGSYNLATQLGGGISLLPLNQGRADTQFVKLPNGQLFDPNGSYDAPLRLPIELSIRAVLSKSTEWEMNYTWNLMSSLVGKRDTLKAVGVVNSSGTTGDWTCTARLEQFSGVVTPPFHERRVVQVLFIFSQITEWDEPAAFSL